MAAHSEHIEAYRKIGVYFILVALDLLDGGRGEEETVTAIGHLYRHYLRIRPRKSRSHIFHSLSIGLWRGNSNIWICHLTSYSLHCMDTELQFPYTVWNLLPNTVWAGLNSLPVSLHCMHRLGFPSFLLHSMERLVLLFCSPTLYGQTPFLFLYTVWTALNFLPISPQCMVSLELSLPSRYIVRRLELPSCFPTLFGKP